MTDPLDTAYIPLHLHSDYSLNDGLQGVGAIVAQAAAMNFPALALTDFNNVAGFLRFYQACRKAGIKPLLGADLQCREADAPGGGERAFTLTALAMDRRGKEHLYELLSAAWLGRNSPDINEAACTYADLQRYGEGLILLDGVHGDLAGLLRGGAAAEAERRLDFYQTHFPGRFCLEITRTGRPGEREFERAALRWCLARGLPPVATNDTRFLFGPEHDYPDGMTDYFVHDVRVAIQRGLLQGNADLAREYSDRQYLRSQQEMRALFADLPEALENTRRVAARCNVCDPRVVELDIPRLPRYDTGAMSADDKLRQLAREGLRQRLEFLFPDPAERARREPDYRRRLEHELDVIVKMRFPGYFLIVQDFINWSKTHGVPVGPGRGSGGGSLVAYALRITDLDPLRFNLLFERFLNSERVSMPDFDVDFCQTNRGKTLQYVKDCYDAKARARYGETAVAQIAAFGTLAAKAALKAVGRAIGLPYGRVDYIAKLVPDKPGTTLAGALGQSGDREPAAPDFVRLYRDATSTDQETAQLINLSLRVEGVIRSIGKHAAGVVISPTKLNDFSPLMLDADGNPITQFDKKDVEHAGLVKFDFLGLATLTVIADALGMINPQRARAGQPPLRTEDIPYADAAAFAALQRCQTTAVFQLESSGMRNLVAKMQPDRFEDLIALVALYRPGPLDSGMAESFVNRKHGREAVAYPNRDFEVADLKPALGDTYGVIVYQEQVMQVAQIIAGYTLGGADILRRAMGKKLPAEMAQQREVFRRGAVALGRDEGICMKIFDCVEKFAAYGFNKSHSAAYALVAWWTLWLKIHYPAAFLAAMMTGDALNTDKLISYIDECRRLHVTVNPPDVNSGAYSFTLNDRGEVVYGFIAIKGISEYLLRRVVAERREHGPFTDVFDFVARCYVDAEDRRLLTKLTLEALIKSGALDRLGHTRAALMAGLPLLLTYGQQQYDNRQQRTADLFADAGEAARPRLPDAPEWDAKRRLYYEKKLLGLYLSGNPIDAYRAEITALCGPGSLKDLLVADDRGGFCQMGVIVTDYAQHLSSRNQSPYYFVTVTDGSETGEVTLYDRNAERFTRVLERYRNVPDGTGANQDDEARRPPLVLILELRRQLRDDGGTRLQVRTVRSLEELREQRARALTLVFSEDALFRRLRPLENLLRRNALRTDAILKQLRDGTTPPEDVIKGCPVNLRIDNAVLRLQDRLYRYQPTEDLIDGIRELGGPGAVEIEYD